LRASDAWFNFGTFLGDRSSVAGIELATAIVRLSWFSARGRWPSILLVAIDRHTPQVRHGRKLRPPPQHTGDRIGQYQDSTDATDARIEDVKIHKPGATRGTPMTRAIATRHELNVSRCQSMAGFWKGSGSLAAREAISNEVERAYTTACPARCK
jgi:hypothetical protein